MLQQRVGYCKGVRGASPKYEKSDGTEWITVMSALRRSDYLSSLKCLPEWDKMKWYVWEIIRGLNLRSIDIRGSGICILNTRII